MMLLKQKYIQSSLQRGLLQMHSMLIACHGEGCQKKSDFSISLPNLKRPTMSTAYGVLNSIDADLRRSNKAIRLLEYYFSNLPSASASVAKDYSLPLVRSECYLNVPYFSLHTKHH